MKYITNVALDYESLFTDYNNTNPKDLIANISTINSLEIISYFTAQIHTRERNQSTQIELLKIWTERMPNEIFPLIENFIYRINVKKKSEFNFINNVSSLILTQFVLENKNDIEPLEDLDPEQELNLFKAYLWCTQNWTNKHIGIAKTKINSTEDLISFVFPTQLPYLEILEFKDFRVQFLKAIYFFKFIEENAIFKSYLDCFLVEYEIENWQKYLVNILSLYVRKFEQLKTPTKLNIQNEFPEIIEFINQFTLDINDFQNTTDFNSLRKTPIYKIDENNFLFLNLNFFVDKLFQGIQFDFFRIIKKNKLKYNSKEIKEFDQFRSIYGEQISEKGIFYETINYSFEKNKYKLIDGESLKNILKTGEPDFYIRDKMKIYLFEYKDVILNSGVKHSYKFEEIKNEISKKMISNQSGSQKGITQLFNSISKIKNGEYDKVDELPNLKDCIIYPIIVFTDFAFNLPGVNYFLNKEFKSIVSESELNDKNKIQNLTLIDIDTLLKFQDLFREKKIKINNLLNEYQDSSYKKDDKFDQIGTFNLYIHDKTKKMKYDSPKILLKEVEKMLPTK